MIPICLSCHQPMTLCKKFKAKPRGKKKTNYAIRRYECTLCETFETVWGGGMADVRNAHDANVEAGNCPSPVENTFAPCMEEGCPVCSKNKTK